MIIELQRQKRKSTRSRDIYFKRNNKRTRRRIKGSLKDNETRSTLGVCGGRGKLACLSMRIALRQYAGLWAPFAVSKVLL